MQKICAACGTVFSCRPSHYAKKTYCSRACMALDYKQRLQGTKNPHFKSEQSRVCQHCLTAFHARNNDSQRYYCTAQCYHAARTQAKQHLIASGVMAEKKRRWKRQAYHRTHQPQHLPQQLLLPGILLARKRRYPTRLRMCLACHAPFKERRHRLYCPNCSYVMRPCVICQAPFRVHRATVLLTCSASCSATYRSVRQQGAKSHRWQGGITPDHIRRRTAKAYKDWRTTIFTRDDFTYALCQQRGGKLAAHHIQRVKECPERIYDTANGITLCWPCHRSIHWKEEAYEAWFLALAAFRASS